MKKLLIVTQALDLDDPVLGVYHDWLLALTARFTSVEIIALRLGRYHLPAHVHVHTLGKESGRRSRFSYAFRFLVHVWRLRNDYDTVFVHMNQEYVLIAGLLWKLLHKPVFLWRNHGSGSVMTRIAAVWCRTVFYTSSASYTARFRNARQMPVGVDLTRFSTETDGNRISGSVLMVGRIAPKKHVRDVVDALASSALAGSPLTLTLVGTTLPEHESYRNELVSVAASANVGLSLRGGVAHDMLSRVYHEHDIVVNVSEPGMFDKTMLEALASGCVLLTRHEDLAAELDGRCRTTGEPSDIAKKLLVLSSCTAEERAQLVDAGRRVAARHSLESLIACFAEELYA